MDDGKAPESASVVDMEEKLEVVPRPMPLHENYDSTGACGRCCS